MEALKPLIIIQAREKSKRLDKKILKKIKNKSLIEIMFNRIKDLKKKYKIIYAIPKNNFILKKEILKFHSEIYEGDEENVLSRFYNCALSFGAKENTAIIRLTSDCPLIEKNIIIDFYNIFKKNKYDYASNTLNPTYPDGLDVEIFKFSELQDAYFNSRSNHDREHVTPYIKRKSLNKFNFYNKHDLSDVRITLDNNDDYKLISRIIKKYGPNCNLNQIIKYYFELRNQKIINFNSSFRNFGSNSNNDNYYWERAKLVIPGGNSLYSKRPELYAPNLWPSHYMRAKKYKIWSLSGKKYSDLSSMGVGTNILGYANPKIDNEVIKAIKNSNLSSLNSFEEVLLAEKLIDLHPWADMVKYARTGAEANSIAIRLARAYSGKNEIAICGYHGWHDWYLSASVKNNKNFSKILMENVGNLGTPSYLKKYVHTFQYNDFKSLEKLINNNKKIGVIIMEVMRNFEPKNNFLKKIRRLCSKNNIILIFDECTSGFREVYGGLHLKYDVYPDLAMFGKSLGNGFAINAVIGKRDIMNFAKKTFISSTFWTERSGSVAGIKTLDLMQSLKSWDVISHKGRFIKEKWRAIAKKNHLKIDIFGLDAIPKFNLPYKNWLAYKTFITQEFLSKKILASNTIYLSTVHDMKILNIYLDELNRIFKIIKNCEDGLDIFSLLKRNICAHEFTRLN